MTKITNLGKSYLTNYLTHTNSMQIYLNPNHSYSLAGILRSTFLFIGIMFSVSLILAQGPGKASYLQAENLRKQNKCEDAITKYNDALRLEPTNYKYYFQMGKCQYKLKDFESAKASFQATVEYKRTFTPAYSLLAKISKNENDFGQAIYNYEQAAKYETSKGKKVQFTLLLVNLLIKEDRIREAARHIEEAKALDPTNPNILFYSGELASRDERWEEARDNYEKALASERLKNANPSEKAKYYYFLGVALSNLGDAAGAKRAWSKANFGPYKQLISEQMRQNNHVYYYKIAVSYYLNGEYDQSEEFLAKTLELQNNFSSAFVLKGKIEGKKGNMAGALAQYQQAINNEQSKARKSMMYGIMAKMQLSDNDPNGALDNIAKAIQLNPQGSDRYLHLKARAEYQTGRYHEAIESLERLIAAGVDTKAKAKYNFMLGMAAKKTADFDKARSSFNNAMYGPYKPAATVELKKISDNK